MNMSVDYWVDRIMGWLTSPLGWVLLIVIVVVGVLMMRGPRDS